ncbi:MAG: hypothetical protein HKM06_02140, partial [Spirochaetales bacterium]|nr:hypothetical protein [Spirochaetales bacterium]
MTPAELGLSGAPTTPSIDAVLTTPPPQDGIFTWPQIQAQVAWGLATHLRNYDLDEAQWNQAVQIYQDKA